MKLILKLLKFLAPLIGAGGAYAALFTNILSGLGLPVWLIKLIAVILGAGGVGVWLDWVLKRYLTEARLDKWVADARYVVETFFYGIGVAITGGMSKLERFKKLWNSTLEPWAILIFDKAWTIVEGIPVGLKRGLLSDNPSFKDG